MFGYLENEMKGRNIEMLMASFYQKHHNLMLEKNIASSQIETKDKHTEVTVFAKHKSGYIFPIILSIVAYPNVLNKWQYVGIAKIDRKVLTQNCSYILLDNDQNILDISDRMLLIIILHFFILECFRMLKLNAPLIHKRLLKLSFFIPKLENHFDEFFDDGKRTKMHFHQNFKMHEENISKKLVKSVDFVFVVKGTEINVKKLRKGKKGFGIHCEIKKVTMGESIEVGYCVKITENERIKPKGSHLSKEWEEFKALQPPEFKFSFHPIKETFIRVKNNSIFI